jgi:HSP20 family protein
VTATVTATATATGRPGRLSTRHSRASQPTVPVDIYHCEDHYVVLCDLPGLDPGSLDVQIEGTTITIHAHRSAPHAPEATLVTGHRPYGAINQRIQLAQPATSTGITATYTDGVLTLTIPADGARPRHLHDQRSPAHVLHAVN